VFGVQFDRFQYQVDLIGGVDLAGDTVEGTVCHLERFGEVMEPVDTLGMVVFHEEHNTGAEFRPGDEG
jgi:hypothetical protein